MRRSWNKIRQVKSHYIIFTAFILSLIIILLIYDSNRRTLEAKISNATIEKQAQEYSTQTAALDMMESVQKLMNDLKTNPNDYNLIVGTGNAFFDIRRYKEAIKYYKKANAIKSVTEVMIDLGVCYFNIGDLDSALIIMEDGIKKNPDHKQGLYNLGIVLYKLGDTEGAMVKWRHLINVHPNTIESDRVQQYIDEIKNTQTGT